jgi:hypothetical protein
VHSKKIGTSFIAGLIHFFLVLFMSVETCCVTKSNAVSGKAVWNLAGGGLAGYREMSARPGPTARFLVMSGDEKVEEKAAEHSAAEGRGDSPNRPPAERHMRTPAHHTERAGD